MGKPPHFILQWRLHRSLTQEQLAERVGISRPHLSKIERFVRNYDQPLLERLANALMTEPASLIMRDPTDPEGIWSIWDQVPAVERPRAIALLKVIIGDKAKAGES